MTHIFCVPLHPNSAFMGNYLNWCLRMVIALLLVSCSGDRTLERLEQIKTVGNTDPEKALVMLDSLEVEVREGDDYIWRKYDLLRIRLNDKADKMPGSDIMIRQLVEYFGREGSNMEKQEVFYYAGSVYRDLQDTPRALQFFFKSLEFTGDGLKYDTIMLRNTYSNLDYLFFRVQDYGNALDMAQKELEACRLTRTDDVLPYMHIGAASRGVRSISEAKAAFDSAYVRIIRSEDAARYQASLIHLLCNFSELGEMQKARKCFSLIADDPLEKFSPFPCIAFAQYHESSGRMDSAIIYCRRVLDDGTDLFNTYDAAKMLFRIYHRMGDAGNAARYAEEYMHLSDSMDFGKRQELAATVNNEYKYHLDRKKEQELKDEKERYKTTLLVVSLSAALLASIGYILYVRRRNRHLREVIALSSELQRISDGERRLREDILQKERQLSERMEQNKMVVKLLHQSELENKSEDVTQAVKQSSTGKKNMTSAEWKQLYQAVDELYPAFREKLLKELGTFTEQQMQVCYLMRIGLSNPQIQNMTNLSRATVWRWVKKYNTILKLDEKTHRR